jgi:hypothetical protein
MRFKAMGDLYVADILQWSEQQGKLLRRLATGDRVNDQVDWANVAEEIESVGRSELTACKSHLRQALLHFLNAEAWPQSRDAPHWRSEMRMACANAADAFSPSMRQHIDMAEVYARARRALPEVNDGQPPGPVSETCPFTLDAVLAGI